MDKWHRKEAGREALGEPDTVSGSILGGSDKELSLSYGIAARDGHVALRGMWRKNEGCILSFRPPRAPNRPVWRPPRSNVVYSRP